VGVSEKAAIFDTVRIDYPTTEAAQAVLARCDAAKLNVRSLGFSSLTTTSLF